MIGNKPDIFDVVSNWIIVLVVLVPLSTMGVLGFAAALRLINDVTR